MANPGPYPMGPAMGGPMQSMGGPPMGMMPRRPVRQGTSRVVPVVVSAGLAIGVFCGLLFGLGTGRRNATAQPQTFTNKQAPTDDYTPETLANPSLKGSEKTGKAGSAAGSAVAAAGSGSADPAAGSNAGSADTGPKPVKLIVEITPETVAQTAKVYVDNVELSSLTADIPLEPGATKKKIKLLVKAPGYKDVEQETELEGESVTVKLDLIKSTGRPAQTAGKDGTSRPPDTAAPPPRPTGSTGTPRTPPKNTGKTKNGKGSAGGLIDI
jgi:hypothetical protein